MVFDSSYQTTSFQTKARMLILKHFFSLSPGWKEEQPGLPPQDEVPGCRATAFRRDLQNPDDEGREVLPQQSLKVNVQQMLRMATADQHRHRQLQIPGVERGQERMQTESESAGSIEGAP